MLYFIWFSGGNISFMFNSLRTYTHSSLILRIVKIARFSDPGLKMQDRSDLLLQKLPVMSTVVQGRASFDMLRIDFTFHLRNVYVMIANSGTTLANHNLTCTSLFSGHDQIHLFQFESANTYSVSTDQQNQSVRQLDTCSVSLYSISLNHENKMKLEIIYH